MSKLADNLELAARIVRDPSLKWQFESHNHWVNADERTLFIDALYHGYDIRLKPTPQYVPWSFKTRPEGAVWVRRKDETFDQMVVMWGTAAATLFYNGLVSYRALLDYYTLLDGSPCGTLSSTIVVED